MENTELALLIDQFMRRIHFGLQSKAHIFDTAHVGPGGGVVLLTLAEMDVPSLNALTQRVARDKSQMTRTIKSLEAKGLVVRKPCPNDGRVTLVQLTPEGEGVVATLQAVLTETIGEILDPISDAQEAMLKDLLARALNHDTHC